MTLLRLGALLRERRGGRGLREVAQDIGISPATLTRVEGGRLPDLLTFQKICAWLNLNPGEILGIPLQANEETAQSDSTATAVHLRAERELTPAAASDLAQLIMAAHRELARLLRQGRMNVPTGI